MDALKKIESDKVSMEVIHSAVGTITESDVALASASHAVILGFHTRIDSGVTDKERANKFSFPQGAENPAAWFTKIVVNVCRDELRRRSKRRLLPEPPASIAGGLPDLLAVRDEIGRAVARLSADEQLVIGLRFGRDLTVPQIAAYTGLAEGTVKSRLHHSLEHVRSALAAERRAEEPRR